MAKDLEIQVFFIWLKYAIILVEPRGLFKMGCFLYDRRKKMKAKSQMTREEILKRMAELRKQDYARPNDYCGIDKYDPDWEKEARAEGYAEYKRLQAMLD